MKSREAALRAKRFEVAARARKADDLIAMAGDLEAMAADLERQIATEEERTGIKDRSHFSYSTFAQAANQRRENLLVTIADVNAQIEAAKEAYREARAALDALESDEAREIARHHGKSERNGAAYG